MVLKIDADDGLLERIGKKFINVFIKAGLKITGQLKDDFMEALAKEAEEHLGVEVSDNLFDEMRDFAADGLGKFKSKAEEKVSMLEGVARAKAKSALENAKEVVKDAARDALEAAKDSVEESVKEVVGAKLAGEGSDSAKADDAHEEL